MGEKARDDINREIEFLQAKLQGREWEFLIAEEITRLDALGVDYAAEGVQLKHDLLQQIKEQEAQKNN